MTTTARQPEMTVAVAGSGEDAARWIRALRGVDGVSAEAAELTSPDDLLQFLSRDGVAAVTFADDYPDLAGAIKRALISNRHVLVTASTAISARQLASLDALARRRGRVLLFDTDALADERIDFVRKMATGPQALWRPRYLRSLRTGAHHGRSLDALAIADIGLALGVMGGRPSRVTAVSPRVDDESGAADVVMVTLMFDGGPAARIDVSLIEPEPRHEIAVACDGRTLILDAFNARAPLQIQAAARHNGPQRGQWGETVSEHPVGDPADRLARAAALFVAAVRSRDIEASNARELVAAASVWEAARASIARGGEPVQIGDGDDAVQSRPALKLIVGGGHADASYPPPELTLVRGTRPPAPEPLESA